jgi:hypothetical protein
MTDSKVIRLHPEVGPIPGEPDENVVAILEELLAEAKEGRLVGIACATLNSDKTTDSFISCTASGLHDLCVSSLLITDDIKTHIRGHTQVDP